MHRSTPEQNHDTMNLLLTLSFVLLAVPFCSGISDYGDETAVKWSDYPQAMLIEDPNGGSGGIYNMGFWMSRKFVVAPSKSVEAGYGNLILQSGDIPNTPMTHIVDKLIFIDSINSGEVVLYKICNPPTPPLTTQSLVEADYWDAAAGNSSGLFLYVKNPSKVLYTRTTGNLPKQSDCASLLSQGECTATQTTAAHQVCAEWDPKPNACQHIVDSSGVVKTNPWLLIDGKMQAFIVKTNCKKDGSSLSGPIFGTIRFSLSAIKTATFS